MRFDSTACKHCCGFGGCTATVFIAVIVAIGGAAIAQEFFADALIATLAHKVCIIFAVESCGRRNGSGGSGCGSGSGSSSSTSTIVVQ